MMFVPQLGEKTGKVLSAVLEQAMDGYTLQSKTGLSPEDLAQAVQILRESELVGVEGAADPASIRSAYVWVPPGAKGNAQFALRGWRSTTAKAF